MQLPVKNVDIKDYHQPIVMELLYVLKNFKQKLFEWLIYL